MRIIESLEQRDADKVERLVREHALSLGKHIEQYAKYLD
jgi:DNA-binding GntR family transcriptional regulator